MKKLLMATIVTVSFTTGTAGVIFQVKPTEAVRSLTSAVYHEFIEARGTQAMRDHIVMPESGGTQIRLINSVIVG